MVFLNVHDVLALNDDIELVFTHPKNPEVQHRCLTQLNSLSAAGILELACYPTSPPYPEWLDVETPAHLYTVKPNGIWSCPIHNIVVTAHSLRGKVLGEIEQVQRRRHVRVSYNGFVTLEIEKSFQKQADGTSVPSRFSMAIQNISAGGMRILSPIPLMNEQVVKLQFEVKTQPKQGKPDSKIYTLQARVLYGYSPEDSPSGKPILIQRDVGNKFLCALQFLDTPPSIEKQLMQQCFQLEIEQRKAGWLLTI
jgi:hypothetical protein